MLRREQFGPQDPAARPQRSVKCKSGSNELREMKGRNQASAFHCASTAPSKHILAVLDKFIAAMHAVGQGRLHRSSTEAGSLTMAGRPATPAGCFGLVWHD